MLCNNVMATIFFNENDKYDYIEIVNHNESALKWGEELFIHYRDMSTPLIEI